MSKQAITVQGHSWGDSIIIAQLWGSTERWMPDYYQVWGSWEGFLKTLLLMGLAFIFCCICLIFTGTPRSFIFSARPFSCHFYPW